MDIVRLFKQKGLSTTVLVISGYLAEKVPQQLQSLGIQHVLPKPTVVTQLRSAVASAMA